MNRTIFEAASRGYTWRYALAAADFRSEAAPVRRRLAASLALRAYADEQGFDVDAADVETGLDEFRVQHGLLSAEDMERWLAHCGLTLDDVAEFFTRRLLAARFRGETARIVRDYAPSDDDVTGQMWAESIVSGGFDRLTVPLAWRVAVRLDGRTTCTPADAAAALRDAEARLAAWAIDPAWLAELAEMEATFAATERALLTPGRLEREIWLRSLQLTRIDLAEAVFPDVDQAREAYACAVDEGESLHEVAARSGGVADRTTWFYDDAPEDVRSLLFSAPEGTLFPPEAREGLFAVREVRRRIEPTVSDAEVLARVRDRIVAAEFDAVMGRHVRWLFHPWNPT